MQGTLDGHRITAVLRLAEKKEFLLLSRGFHWIAEFPFNR
jgi:hypothetical protein